jgi:hypothetical protein
MRNIYYYLACFILLVSLNSCIKWDNYDLPKETFRGTITDKTTGKPFNTEIGANGVRIKMMELSWTASTVTPWYFYTLQDGSFNNTKVFAGNYNIEPQGAFVPLVLTDGTGAITSDLSVTSDIKGITNVDFQVEPFLNIEWVGDPVVNANGTITVQVIVTRGTTNTSYQQAVTDVYLYINNSSTFVGNNNYDARYSTRLTGTAASTSLNKTTTITTTGTLLANNTYYLRVGARINTTIQGVQRYNYSTVVSAKTQ